MDDDDPGAGGEVRATSRAQAAPDGAQLLSYCVEHDGPAPSTIYSHLGGASGSRVSAAEANRRATTFTTVRLNPSEVRTCASAVQPDCYVTEAVAREISGADAPDGGTDVGPIESRIPQVQYLATESAAHKYGCYVLPASQRTTSSSPSTSSSERHP